jgi:hypothetical protein
MELARAETLTRFSQAIVKTATSRNRKASRAMHDAHATVGNRFARRFAVMGATAFFKRLQRYGASSA